MSENFRALWICGGLYDTIVQNNKQDNMTKSHRVVEGVGGGLIHLLILTFAISPPSASTAAREQGNRVPVECTP